MGDNHETTTSKMRRFVNAAKTKAMGTTAQQPPVPLPDKPVPAQMPHVLLGDRGELIVSLDAIAQNWVALDALTQAQTGVVVKADAYGLGADRIAPVLADAGAWRFFVATVSEGEALRTVLGPDYDILIFSGHAENTSKLIAQCNLIPMLNSVSQITRHFEHTPEQNFAIQLDTGMNRLGLELPEWDAVRGILLENTPFLIASHLACSDTPEHPMNRYQLDAFTQATKATGVPLSLSATGGIFLGDNYHFDLTRPGIGLYGGLPFVDARPVVKLDLPVIQTRDLVEGEYAGYGNTWRAERPTRLATVSGGYSDGLLRTLSNNAMLWHEDVACPVVGRVSMDLITADVTDLDVEPTRLSAIGQMQDIDLLAQSASTIGYEILTSLGRRFDRRYDRS